MSMTDVPSLTTNQHFLSVSADIVPSSTLQRPNYEPSDDGGSTAPNSGRQAMVPLPPLDGYYPTNNMYIHRPPSINSQQTDYPDTSPSAGPKQRAGVDPKAPFWASYNTEAAKSDRETTRGWTSSLDFLLIVTGLFSAIVTGFLVMDMSPETSDVYANGMVQYLVATTKHHLLDAVDIPLSLQRELYNLFSRPPPPSAIATAIVTFWSTSLTCTLTIFVYAFYVKFWLREYQRDLRNGSMFDCAQRRQARWDAMLKFKVEEWILFLPLLMHIAVICFVAALILKLWTYHRFAAYVQLVLSVLVFIVYAWLTIWPAFKEMCPYHNTAMVMVPRIFCGLWGYFAAGGRKIQLSILRRIPAPLLKWLVPEELDLEKGSVEAESTLPLYQAHPRTGREEQFIARKSKDLTWNAVAWFLETSREASYVDLALRSIRTLPYVPRKVFEFLPTRIPRFLYSKIVSDSEDIVSEGETDPRAYEVYQAKTLEVYECTLSLIHLLKCVALDAGDSGANLAPLACISDSSSYTYAPLDESMMQAWAAYKSSPKEARHSLVYTLERKEETSWPTRNFAALLSMETLFYHLHPHTKVGDSNPLHDLHFLLDRHVEKGDVLNGRSLALLLDSLVYVLGGVKDGDTRDKILGVLIKAAGKLGGDDYLTFRPLASCLKLFADGDPANVIDILQENMDAPRERHFWSGPGSGHRALLDTLQMLSCDDVHAARLTDITWAAYLFASSTLSAEAAASEPILRENHLLLVDKTQLKTKPTLSAVSFFAAVYATVDDGEPIMQLLCDVLEKVPSFVDDSRDVIATTVLNGLKARLLDRRVVETEKKSMCRKVSGLLQTTFREDDTWFLKQGTTLSTVSFFAAVYAMVDDGEPIMLVLCKVLENLPSFMDDSRDDIATTILNSLKARLLDKRVVELEKISICEMIFGLLQLNLREDETRFLIRRIVCSRWLEGLGETLEPSVVVGGQALLKAWEIVVSSSGDADERMAVEALKTMLILR